MPTIGTSATTFLRLTPLALAGLLLATLTAPLWAAPQPDVVPRRWQLDVEPGELRVVTVDTARGPRPFYYMTYLVTNNSGEDVDFYPAFIMTSDRGGELRRSNRGVPLEAARAIQEIAGRGRVEMLSEFDAHGLLLQGEENAREAVVIWPVESFMVDEVKIFLEGFSGETKSVTRPDNGETEVLRKTLMLTHEVPGQLDPSARNPITRTDSRWILR
jgi:hypothetical protein